MEEAVVDNKNVTEVKMEWSVPSLEKTEISHDTAFTGGSGGDGLSGTSGAT